MISTAAVFGGRWAASQASGNAPTSVTNVTIAATRKVRPNTRRKSAWSGGTKTIPARSAQVQGIQQVKCSKPGKPAADRSPRRRGAPDQIDSRSERRQFAGRPDVPYRTRDCARPAAGNIRLLANSSVLSCAKSSWRSRPSAPNAASGGSPCPSHPCNAVAVRGRLSAMVGWSTARVSSARIGTKKLTKISATSGAAKPAARTADPGPPRRTAARSRRSRGASGAPAITRPRTRPARG